MALVCGLTLYIKLSLLVQAWLWQVEENSGLNFVIVSGFTLFNRDWIHEAAAKDIRPAGGSICLIKRDLWTSC